MSPNHYQKKIFSILDKDKSYNIEDAYNNQGLKTKEVWYEAFDSAPQNKLNILER
jgi:hypothetical protein